MKKRLKDFKPKGTKRPVFKVLPMQFGDDEVTKRIVKHNAKRVIEKHKDELQELAYK